MKLPVFILLIFWGTFSQAQSKLLTVVSNQDGAPAQLKKSQVKSIFLGETERWPNGNKIKIALFKPATNSGKTISKKLVDMSADDFAHYWEEQNFSGKNDRPQYFKNMNDMLVYVSETPGAIGIIDELPASSGFRFIQVDGKKSF